MIRALITQITLPLLLSAQLSAQPASEFYQNKRLRIIVHESAGSSFDVYSRILARHLPKYMPPLAGIIIENMPGSGGIRATNYVETIAPSDGTVLATAGAGILVDQALGLTPSLIPKLTALHWLGSVSDSNSVIVTWRTSPSRTIEDAKKRDTTLAVGNSGALGVQAPILLNALLGTRFKVVKGYTSAEQGLAMERGETEGRGAFPWSGYKSLHPHWITNQDIHILVQAGAAKEPDLPDVPLACDLGATEQEKKMLLFLCNAVSIGRPYFMATAAPIERVAFFRTALENVMADDEFTKEAQRDGLDIRLTKGEAIQSLVKNVTQTDPLILKAIKAIIEMDAN